MDAVQRQEPSGWIRTADAIDGVPLWKRRGEQCYVATRDMDQLRFLGVALARFDQMSGPELHTFMTS